MAGDYLRRVIFAITSFCVKAICNGGFVSVDGFSQSIEF